MRPKGLNRDFHPRDDRPEQRILLGIVHKTVGQGVGPRMLVERCRWLNSSGVGGKKFFITGFADSKGGWQTNYRLACERAIQVARELERKGVRVLRDSVLSLSYMAPTACNDHDLGVARNRRVEIWVAQ